MSSKVVTLFIPVGSSSTPATPGVEMTGQDVVTAALREIRVTNAIDPPAPEDTTFGLENLNRMLDAWNANERRRFTFQTTFSPFTLTPSRTIHTIGPTGHFVVLQRPQTIDGATILLTGTSPLIRIPLNLRSKEWYQAQGDQASTISIPSDLYYEPTFPNGSLYLWLVPSTAYQVELMTRGLLSALTLTDRISLPAGYRDALIYTLAERLVFPMGVEMPQGLPRAARDARAIVIDANTEGPPPLQTRDSGMGPDDAGGSSFNYRNRSYS